MATVRIERVRAYEVVVPARSGAIHSPSLGGPPDREWDRLPICLLAVTMSDGITALGEVGRGRTLAEIDPWLRSLVGVALRGCSFGGLPAEWQGRGLWGGVLEERYPPASWTSPSPLIGAMEMVLLDWAGRRLGCRAADLLGGPCREEVPVDYWCGRQTPDDLRRTVERARSRGFRGLKMKGKLGDPVVEQIAAIREVGGVDFSVTLDPMYQWFSPLEALPILKGLEAYGEGIRIEDPFPDDQPAFWQRARQVSAVPLIWHARGMASLRRGLEERCADGFNCGGGVAEFLTCAHAVEVAGYACWRGSGLELGVGQAAGMHVAAVARACVLPSDFQGALIREHTLTTWDWPYRDGTLPLPPGDGLGVELDFDALQHFRRADADYQ